MYSNLLNRSNSAGRPCATSTHDLRIDETLLRELENLCTGENVHRYANLAGAYRNAVEMYQRCGERDFRQIAEQAELALRKLLAQLRQRKAFSSMGMSIPQMTF